MTSSDPEEELLERFRALEKQNEELVQENQELREENKRLRARLRWHEGPHTPPSKERSSAGESSSSDDKDENDSAQTDGGNPGRKQSHEPANRHVATSFRLSAWSVYSCAQYIRKPDVLPREALYGLISEIASSLI